MGEMINLSYENVGMRLPNGKVQVVKSNKAQKGQVYESEEQFYKDLQPVNDGKNSVNTIILDMINE